MNRTRWAAALLIGAAATGGTAEAGPRRTVSCQKNMEDGRVLVDGRAVGNRPYRVLRYTVTRNEGLWTYGRCLIKYR